MFTLQHAWPFANTSMELYKGYLGEKDNMTMAWAEGAADAASDEEDEAAEGLSSDEPSDPLEPSVP